LIVVPFLFSCSGDNVTNDKKIVELTIHPETGYNEFLFADDMYGEFLQYSEGKNPQKRILLSPGESFNNFKFQKGYNYVLKVKKITLKHPLQDNYNVIYEYIETLSKEKAIEQETISEVVMEVAPVRVNFIPRGKEPLQAYLTKITTETKPKPILKIEGFDFEKGYTYILKVKKSIQVNPYKETYSLVEILSKQQ